MGKKGLCNTCENDKGCVFQSRLPVLQCEEFTDQNHRVTAAKHLKRKNGKCLEEITTEE